MSLTSLQLLNYAAWMPGVLRELGVGWVKWLNPPRLPSNPFAGLQVDVRIWTDDADGRYIAQGEAGGRQFVRDMLPRWKEFPWATCYELANEPAAINDWSKLPLLRDYAIGAMREADAQGIKLCIWQAPEGSPHDDGTDNVEVSRQKALVFAPAVRYAVEHGHYVGAHFYWRPGVEGPTGRWHALGNVVAVVEWWAQAGIDTSRLQFLATECGIDGGIAHHYETRGKGWRHFVSEEAFAADMVALEKAARRYPWLKALLYFIAQHPGWQTFDMPENLMRCVIEPIRALGTVQPPALPPADFAWIGRRFNREEFAEYVAGLSAMARRAIVVHHTWKPTLEQWIERGGAYWMPALARHYKALGWSSGPHLFCGPDGIWLGTPLEQDGTHAGRWNPGTWGVEIVGDYTSALPSGETRANAISALAALARKGQLGIDKLVPHSQAQAVECPGALLREHWRWLTDQVQTAMQPAVPYLPEHDPAKTPAEILTASRWWNEEMRRLWEREEYSRLGELLLSQTKLLYRAEQLVRRGAG